MFFQELLRVIIYEKRDGGSAGFSLSSFDLKICVAFPNPLSRLSTFLMREGIYFHFFGDHESGVETKTEVTNDLLIVCFVFVFFHKLCRA